jgi:hypothetical protein
MNIISENIIINNINDNLKNKNLNATIEKSDNILHKYIINYNINEIYEINDINNFIREYVNVVFYKNIIIEDNIMFIL